LEDYEEFNTKEEVIEFITRLEYRKEIEKHDIELSEIIVISQDVTDEFKPDMKYIEKIKAEKSEAQKKKKQKQKKADSARRKKQYEKLKKEFENEKDVRINS